MEWGILWVVLIIAFRVIAAKNREDARRRSAQERAPARPAKAQTPQKTQETQTTSSEGAGFFDELKKVWEEAKREIELEEERKNAAKGQKSTKKPKKSGTAWDRGAAASTQPKQPPSEADAQDAERKRRAEELRRRNREPAVFAAHKRTADQETAPLARVANAFEDPSVRAIVLADILGPPKARRG